MLTDGMKEGDIILVDLGMSKMYLKLAESLPDDMTNGVTIKYRNRVDVQIAKGNHPETGEQTLNTLWMRTGSTLGMSGTVPSKLVIPKTACYHILAIDKDSKEYKDLLMEFNVLMN